MRDLSLGLHDEPTWSMRVTVDQRKILEAVARSRATGVLASELPSLFPKGSAAAKPQACHHLVKVLEFLGLLTSREIMRVTETKKTTVKKSQACVNKTTVLVLSWIARETGGDFGNDPDLDEIAHVGPKEREALTRTFVEMLRAAKDNVLMEAEFRAEVYKRLRKEEWEKGDDVGEGGLTGRRTGRLYLKIRAEMIAKGIVERMQCAIEGSDGGAGAIAECLRLLPEPLAIADGGAAAVAGEDASAGDVVDDDSLIGFGGGELLLEMRMEDQIFELLKRAGETGIKLSELGNRFRMTNKNIAKRVELMLVDSSQYPGMTRRAVQEGKYRLIVLAYDEKLAAEIAERNAAIAAGGEKAKAAKRAQGAAAAAENKKKQKSAAEALKDARAATIKAHLGERGYLIKAYIGRWLAQKEGGKIDRVDGKVVNRVLEHMTAKGMAKTHAFTVGTHGHLDAGEKAHVLVYDTNFPDPTPEMLDNVRQEIRQTDLAMRLPFWQEKKDVYDVWPPPKPPKRAGGDVAKPGGGRRRGGGILVQKIKEEEEKATKTTPPGGTPAAEGAPTNENDALALAVVPADGLATDAAADAAAAAATTPAITVRVKTAGLVPRMRTADLENVLRPRGFGSAEGEDGGNAGGANASRRVAKKPFKTFRDIAVLQSGFIPAIMTRARYMHGFLVKTIFTRKVNLECAEEEDASSSTTQSAGFNAGEVVMKHMPLELFLRIAGCPWHLQNENSRVLAKLQSLAIAGKTLGDLDDEASRAVIGDANGDRKHMRSVFKDAEAKLSKLIRLLCAMELVVRTSETGGNMRSHKLARVGRFQPSPSATDRSAWISMNVDDPEACEAFWSRLEATFKRKHQPLVRADECMICAFPASSTINILSSSTHGLCSTKTWSRVRDMTIQQRIVLLQRLDDLRMETREIRRLTAEARGDVVAEDIETLEIAEATAAAKDATPTEDDAEEVELRKAARAAALAQPILTFPQVSKLARELDLSVEQIRQFHEADCKRILNDLTVDGTISEKEALEANANRRAERIAKDKLEREGGRDNDDSRRRGLGVVRNRKRTSRVGCAPSAAAARRSA